MANFFDLLRETLGQSQGLMQDVPSGNPLAPYSPGGLVATPEQEAESIAIAQRLGIPVDTPAVPPEGVYEQGIDVNGARPATQPTVPVAVDSNRYLLDAPVSMKNGDWAEERYEANQANEDNPKLERKGYFGIKGTLRDVLGGLGDAFLVGTGKNAIYGPARQQELIGDAMAGHTQAPFAAAERVAQYDPEFSRTIANQAATQEVAQMNAQRMAEKEAAARRAKGIDMLARAAGATNNESYLSNGDRKGMREIMQGLVDSYGLGDEYRLPEAYDENWMRTLQYSGMPTQSQENVRLSGERNDMTRDRNAVAERQGQARIDIARGNAAEQARANRAREEIARARAARSGGGGGRNPTAASIAEPLLQKVINGGTLTPQENEALERTGFGVDRGSGGRGSSRPSQNNRSPVAPRVLGKRPAN